MGTRVRSALQGGGGGGNERGGGGRRWWEDGRGGGGRWMGEMEGVVVEGDMEAVAIVASRTPTT